MSGPLRVRSRSILAIVCTGLLLLFFLERAGGGTQSPGAGSADGAREQDGQSGERTDHEDVVGLPCEGCEAVFDGMPAVASLSSRARIAPPDYPGEPLRIEGTVFDREGRPAPGVIVYAYHTDANGIYPPSGAKPESGASRHGALRGWAVSDIAGGYRFDTIRPAGYPETNTPAHVHMHVIEPGRCTYYIDDILFERDPRLTPANRAQIARGRGGNGIMMPSFSDDGLTHVTRDIVLGEKIPGYPGGSEADSTSARLYERARELALGLDLENAIYALRASFASGFATPMQVVNDMRLFSLIADAEMRPLLRDALRDNARESIATMVSRDEPGNAFVFEGVVVDESTGTPVAGARVDLVQADAGGRFAMQVPASNPRLFAYLRTAADGSFGVRTVHPGAVKDDEGNYVPSHIRLSIVADGFRPFQSETLLDDDPLFTAAAREESERNGVLVTHVEVVEGTPTGAVRVPLRPTSPGR